MIRSVENKNARIIVFGNEKGGCGKSTAAMHAAVGLLRLGFKVGSIDLDGRQGSFTKYFKNRAHYSEQKNSEAPLPMPTHIKIERSTKNNADEAHAEDGIAFINALNKLVVDNDFVVIDTPGNDTYLNRLAHSFADTLVTPVNDSFVDLDLLADIDNETFKPKKPNIYSEMVWEQRKQKILRGEAPIEWIVMRNRIAKDFSKIDARVEEVLAKLSKQYGFKTCYGFTERGVFRELYVDGLTLLDLHEVKDAKMTLDMVQARQEIRDLLQSIGLRRKSGSRKIETPVSEQISA